MNRGNRDANRVMGILMILFSLSISNVVIFDTNFYKAFPHVLFVSHPLLFLFGPLFLFYVLKLTHTGFNFKPLHFIHLLPFFAYVIYLIPFFLLSGEEKIHIIDNWKAGNRVYDFIITPLQIIQLYAYLAAVGFILKKHNQQIKNSFSTIDKINLDWIKRMIFMLAGVFGIMTIFLVLAIIGYSDFTYTYASDTIAILVSLSIYRAGYFGLRQPEIFTGLKGSETIKKYEKSLLTPEMTEQYVQKLLEAMSSRKPYRDSNLTINDLANLISIPSYQLSRIINEKFNHNFFDFVNKYRIEEAKERLVDAKNQQFTILAIAYDAGFNSKSVFNTAFKKHTGLTPSQYRLNASVLAN